MKAEITKTLADGATTLAISGGVAAEVGLFAFINDNGTGLGFIASCVFGLVGTLFYWLNYTAKNANTIKIEELKADNHRMSMQIKHLNRKVSK